MFSMIMIVFRVRQTEQRMRRYSGGHSILRQTKETGVQALMYIGAFSVVFLPVAVLMTRDSGYPASTDINRKRFFAIAFFVKLVTPLQGFFNALIFLRMRLRSLMREGGRLSFLGRCCKVTRTSSETRTTPTQERSPAGTVAHAEDDMLDDSRRKSLRKSLFWKSPKEGWMTARQPCDGPSREADYETLTSFISRATQKSGQTRIIP
jgi:hypothetical protein